MQERQEDVERKARAKAEWEKTIARMHDPTLLNGLNYVLFGK